MPDEVNDGFCCWWCFMGGFFCVKKMRTWWSPSVVLYACTRLHVRLYRRAECRVHLMRGQRNSGRCINESDFWLIWSAGARMTNFICRGKGYRACSLLWRTCPRCSHCSMWNSLYSELRRGRYWPRGNMEDESWLFELHYHNTTRERTIHSSNSCHKITHNLGLPL